MATILGIAGSLREASYNRALLRAVVNLAPDDVVIEVGSIRDIPLYNGDVEANDGIPPSVAALKDRIAAADAVLLVSPEYNQSIPGVFKNAIDWCSRPASDQKRVFGGKPVGLIGATPGRGGTRLAQTAWLPVFRGVGLEPWFGRQLYVDGAAAAFDESGNLTSELIEKLVRQYIDDFAAHVLSRA